MKKLKKLLLLNWHYFTFELMKFDDINFLTGKTGSGKTTIIDALQLLLLGDTTGHFFNKSASDKSNRTLKGYLRCEFSDDDDGGALYLRTGRFSSYIVSEFYDEHTEKPFTIGAVFDSYEDTSYDTKYFIYDGAIPDNYYIDILNVPFNQKDLRNFLLSNYTNVNFYETNVSYREALKEKLGNLNNSFFSLFKKAIPFSPISNIETFITEYVCDVKNNIDVFKMQENIRSYKNLELETIELESRINALRVINELYDNWFTSNDSIAVNNYLLKRYELHTSTQRIETFTRKIEELKYDIEDKSDILEKCKVQLSNLNVERDRLNQEKYSSDIYKKRETVEKELKALENSLVDLENKASINFKNIGLFVDTWIEAIDYFFANKSDDYTKEELLSLANTLKNKLNSLKIDDFKYNANAEVLFDISHDISKLKDTVNQEYYHIKMKSNELKENITLIENDLTTLDKGEKSYDPRLLNFKVTMERELNNRFNEKVSVNFLADLMDINDDAWRPVIETYLAHQRFYLIVEPKYVDAAIRVYDRIKNTSNFADYGIVDTEKVSQLTLNVHNNSIVNEITFKNSHTKAYVESLIGTLVKCEHLDNLRKNNRSVTKDGLLYQGFVIRQMNLRRTTPFIGSVANKHLVEMKVSERNEYLNELKGLNTTLKTLEIFYKIENMTTTEIKTLERIFAETKTVPFLEKQKETLQTTFNELNDNYLATLESRIKDIEVHIEDLEQEKTDLTKDIITFQNMSVNISEVELPKAHIDQENIKSIISKEFDKTWIIEKGEPTFIDIVRTNPHYANQFATLKNEISNTIIKVQKLWNQLVEHRSAYNLKYSLNIDPSLTKNTYYSEEYSDLHDVKLNEYKVKIIESKELAIDEFKNDFLAKLKDNFDAVISQIKDLNDALGHVRFGEDRYEFTVSPRSEYKHYYEMINDELLISGKDISNTIFYSKYEDTIEDLFRQITFVDTTLDYNVRTELEKNIEKFTDYRSYLKFDLLVKNISGSQQSLSRTLQKKSGGETQTPFYIAVLASFGQIYRTHLKNEKNATIRLIVFDEAFSKMDAERIIESVKLLRSLGLQAIVAAPPEKMPDITPLVDNTLCVIRSSTLSTVKVFKDLNEPLI